MHLNAATAPFISSPRRLFRRLGTASVLLVGLICLPSAQAQCSGAGGGGGGAGGRTGPGGGAGGAAGGTFANGASNLGQFQQMAFVAQQQAAFEQQQRMQQFQRQQELAAAQQRQDAISRNASFGTPKNGPAPYTFVEAAQRRRAAYLRVRRVQQADVSSFVIANRDR